MPVGTEHEMLSNCLEFWERIPKYVDATQQYRLRRGGVLESIKRDFTAQGVAYTLRLHPARVRMPGTETHVEWFPSPSDQLVEHALVRLFMARHAGAISAGTAPDLFVRFRLRELYQLLGANRHGRKYAEIRHSLTVLSRAPLEIERQGRRVHNEPILSALSAADDDDGWFVARFHVLVAQAVISGQYRQFPLDRWFAQRRVLARWLLTRMCLQPNLAPEYPHRVLVSEARAAGITLASRLLDDIKAVRQAWRDFADAGLVEPEPATSTTDRAGRRRTLRHYDPIRVDGRLADARFTLVPTQLARSHVIAENVRRQELDVASAPRGGTRRRARRLH